MDKYIFRNLDRQTFKYMGIYRLLDELLEKITYTRDVKQIEVYCNLFEKIYKLTIEDKENKNDETNL